MALREVQGDSEATVKVLREQISFLYSENQYLVRKINDLQNLYHQNICSFEEIQRQNKE